MSGDARVVTSLRRMYVCTHTHTHKVLTSQSLFQNFQVFKNTPSRPAPTSSAPGAPERAAFRRSFQTTHKCVCVCIHTYIHSFIHIYIQLYTLTFLKIHSHIHIRD
jgi:hypothetical protein